MEVQLDLAMDAREPGDRRGHEGRPGGVEAAESQPARVAAGQHGELTLHRRRLPEQLLGAGEEDVAGGCRADRAARALDQDDAEVALEGRHLLGDAGLRVVELSGGAREGALLDDFRERPQTAKIDQRKFRS